MAKPQQSKTSKVHTKTNKGIKKQSKQKLKLQGKLAKHKIERLNQDDKEIDQVRSSLASMSSKKKLIKALDTNDLKAGLLKDDEEKKKNDEVAQDLTKQLEMITGIEL